MAVSVDMLKWKGELFSIPVLSKELYATND